MGFSGFVSSGLVPAVGGALRGVNERRKAEEEQRRYQTQQAQLTSQTEWQRQQAIEAAKRQAMLDELAKGDRAYSRERDARMEERDIRRNNNEIEAGVRNDQNQWAQTILRGVQPVEGLNARGQREQGTANVLDPTGSYQPSPLRPAPKEFNPYTGGGGPGGPKPKVLPSGVATQMFGNRSTLSTIKQALGDVAAHPEAFTLWNKIPYRDFVDKPENVKARAAAANVSSLVIHDRSGAAVTIGEVPRLKPFIPQPGDLPDMVKSKLEELQRQIGLMQEDMASYYGEQGYAIPGDTARGPVRPDSGGESSTAAQMDWDKLADEYGAEVTTKRVGPRP